MTGNEAPPDDDLGAALRDLARAEHDAVPSMDRLRGRIAAEVPGFDPGSPGDPSAPPAKAAAAGAAMGRGTFALAGLVLGATIGALVMHTIDGKNETIRVVEVPVAAPPVPSFAPAPSAPPSIVAPTPSASLATVAPHPSVSASASSSSSAERRIVDDAGVGYARGELAPALDALALHAKSYPGGTLAEEREALAVRILVDAHRHPEARARGAKFRARYPKSLMLPAVEAALASIP